MSSSEQTSGASAGADGAFGATRWTLVRMAGHDSPQSHEALAKLCQTYWYPLYVFVRRLGHSPEDAQDLVQGFFAQVVEKRSFSSADREKGKFRSFLLVALKRYIATERDRAQSLKRGGGQQIISLDEEQTENRYLAEPADERSPDKAFERQWALTLIEQAFKRLEAEFTAAGRAAIFAELKRFLAAEWDPQSYPEMALKLGMTEGTVKVTVHRLRQRYRQALREEIAQTVDTREEVDDEIRYLFAVLS